MLERRYWGVTVLLLTVAFGYVGYRLDDRHPSPPWLIGGLVAGVFVTAVMARAGKEQPRLPPDAARRHRIRR